MKRSVKGNILQGGNFRLDIRKKSLLIKSSDALAQGGGRAIIPKDVQKKSRWALG